MRRFRTRLSLIGQRQVSPISNPKRKRGNELQKIPRSRVGLPKHGVLHKLGAVQLRCTLFIFLCTVSFVPRPSPAQPGDCDGHRFSICDPCQVDGCEGNACRGGACECNARMAIRRLEIEEWEGVSELVCRPGFKPLWLWHKLGALHSGQLEADCNQGCSGGCDRCRWTNDSTPHFVARTRSRLMRKTLIQEAPTIQYIPPRPCCLGCNSCTGGETTVAPNRYSVGKKIRHSPFAGISAVVTGSQPATGANAEMRNGQPSAERKVQQPAPVVSAAYDNRQ